jgi:hypothetical protein
MQWNLSLLGAYGSTKMWPTEAGDEITASSVNVSHMCVYSYIIQGVPWCIDQTSGMCSAVHLEQKKMYNRL